MRIFLHVLAPPYVSLKQALESSAVASLIAVFFVGFESKMLCGARTLEFLLSPIKTMKKWNFPINFQ